MFKIVKKIFSRRCDIYGLTKHEKRVMLKAIKKWAVREGLDLDGDTVTIYFNLIARDVRFQEKYPAYLRNSFNVGGDKNVQS